MCSVPNPRQGHQDEAQPRIKTNRILIVGGVAGGASAAARSRRLCEKCETFVFERGPHVSFANCGLPYFLGGEITERGALLIQTPRSLKARFNLDVRVRTEVIAIDRIARRVTVRELQTGREHKESYDALILSTGAAPLKAPIPGIDRPNHFVVRNIPDVERIMAWSKGCPESFRGCRAIVVGGSFIGLEMAEQLQRRGFAVTLVEALPQVMAPLDELRERLGELPRDRELVVHCHTGQRSYYACRLLTQHGFHARNLTGSYRTWNIASSALTPKCT